MSKMPSPAQLEALVNTDDLSRPLFMLNILKYAQPEEYAMYAAGVTKIVASLGGSVVWSGSIDQVVIGDEQQLGGRHHSVALVRYPSRKAFMQMQSLPEFRAIARHRLKGLDSQWLIACTEIAAGEQLVSKL